MWVHDGLGGTSLLLLLPFDWSSVPVSSCFQAVEDQCIYFNSIENLKERPTHLLVFMQHVILQFDPAPLVRTPTVPRSVFMKECVFKVGHGDSLILILVTNAKCSSWKFKGLHQYQVQYQEHEELEERDCGSEEEHRSRREIGPNRLLWVTGIWIRTQMHINRNNSWKINFHPPWKRLKLRQLKVEQVDDITLCCE